MGSYEYKVIPAPVRGRKGRGISGPEGRFAHSLEVVMNEMAAEGWEYQRAETLPSEEKTGLVGAQTVFRHVLVFRRKHSADLSAYDPRVLGEARQTPLLMAPANDAPAEDAGGLSGLLRRRAASVQSDGEAADAAPLDDLASRFAEDDDTPDEADTPAAHRPAAE